ncbi:MAG: hypothetical protein PHC81_07040, partial [Clostridia bacterium]|nr:hypothetical protein [Clostridia bacterium]
DRLSECNKALEKFKKVKELYPNSNSVPLSLYETAHIYFYRFSDYDNAKLYYTQFIEEATEGERHSVWLKRSISMLEKWDEEENEWEETKAKESSSASTESDNTKLPATSESDVSLNLYQSGDYLIVSGRVENARSYKRTLYIYVTDAVGSKHFVDAVYAKSYEKGTVKSTIKTSKAGPPPYRISYEWND